MKLSEILSQEPQQASTAVLREQARQQASWRLAAEETTPSRYVSWEGPRGHQACLIRFLRENADGVVKNYDGNRRMMWDFSVSQRIFYPVNTQDEEKILRVSAKHLLQQLARFDQLKSGWYIIVREGTGRHTRYSVGQYGEEELAMARYSQVRVAIQALDQAQEGGSE